MYLSSRNVCFYSEDKLVKALYLIFCVFTLLGYIQLIKCIILAFMIPFGAYIIYKLVQQRVDGNGNNQQNNDLFG